MDSIQYCDLYLYFIETPDKLNLIKHLSRNKAEKLADQWMNNDNNHEYMIVTEGSKPYFGDTQVLDVDIDWINANGRTQ